MLLDGAVPPPVQGFALPSAEVQDIPVCPVSRPVDLPLDGSTATWCSTHPFEICATCKPEGASVPSSRSLAKALNSTRPRWWMHSAFEHGPTKEQCTGVKKRVFTCAAGCHLPSKPLCPAVIPALVGRSSKRCKKAQPAARQLCSIPRWHRDWGTSPSCPRDSCSGTSRQHPTCCFQLGNSSGHQRPLLARSHTDLASWSIYRCSPFRSKRSIS